MGGCAAIVFCLPAAAQSPPLVHLRFLHPRKRTGARERRYGTKEERSRLPSRCKRALLSLEVSNVRRWAKAHHVWVMLLRIESDQRSGFWSSTLHLCAVPRGPRAPAEWPEPADIVALSVRYCKAFLSRAFTSVFRRSRQRPRQNQTRFHRRPRCRSGLRETPTIHSGTPSHQVG